MNRSRLLRSPALGSALVALLAVLVLLTLAQLQDLDRLHVGGQTLGLNDQIGYITTARWFADTGELRSHLIYPAYVDEPRWRLYMPGQYCVLAAAYKAFGDHPLTWRLPALVSFVMASVGVFLIGRRIFSGAAGLVAAILFMLLPINGAYAFTAMPQLPFCAAGVLSFCAFCYLPERTRAFWVPLLLVPPFLFRETGALLVIPMAWLSMHPGRASRVGRLLASVGGSMVLLAAVLAWQIHSGKGSLPLDVALTEGFNYADAFSPAGAASLAELLGALPSYALRNLSTMLSSATSRWMAFEPLIVMLLAAILGLLHSPKKLACAVMCLLVVALSLVTFLYEWNAYRGTRTVLFVFPLCAVVAAPVLLGWLESLRERVRFSYARRLPHFLALLLGILWSSRGAQAMARGMGPAHGARTLEWLEKLPIDDSRLFVSPYEISLNYVHAHYPIRWSFVPANVRTLRLLDSTHEIGTLIIRSDQLDLPMAKAIRRLKFVPGQTFKFQTAGQLREYLVFNRPD